MNTSYLLALIVSFGCVCFAYMQMQIDPLFFQAFPSGDKRDLAHLNLKDLMPREPYTEPSPMITACPALPAPAPTTDVNALKPGHIKVVMSMGDSITAAMSAKDITVLSLKEYRGISYCIGGDNGVTTAANLLKQYAPSGLIGQSTATGQRTTNITGFNAAVSGGLSVDMPGQAEWLVNQLKSNPKVNMTEDWKMLTIWIGSNNLCAVCKNKVANDADDYQKHVTEALEYLYANVPRLFVNLVANLDVSKLNGFTAGVCGSLHLYECGCTSTNAALVSATTKEFQARSYKIADTFNSRNNKTFAVVVQPFLINSIIFNRTYLSTADCFHPSALCHQTLSIALWNSMITPVAEKKTKFDQDETPLCATTDSFLYTK